MSKMNPEAKALWIDALLNGKRQQGRGALNRDGKFCCLGVLCDILVEQLGLDVKTGGADGCPDGDCTTCNSVRYYNNNSSYLPGVVAEFAGIDYQGKIPGPIEVKGVVYQHYTLAELNDDGWTFEQIAEVIKEQF